MIFIEGSSWQKHIWMKTINNLSGWTKYHSVPSFPNFIFIASSPGYTAARHINTLHKNAWTRQKIYFPTIDRWRKFAMKSGSKALDHSAYYLKKNSDSLHN